MEEKIELTEDTKYALDIINSNNMVQIKRLWIAILILALLFVGTNSYWIYREFQYEDVVTVTQEVDTGESPAYVNGTGDMTVNGEDKTNHN